MSQHSPIIRFGTQDDAATHRAWFRKRLRDLDYCRLYVVETQDGFPIGQVRFDRSGEGWEISYSLDARCRGVGLARPMLQTAMLKLRSTQSGTIVLGRVKEGNRASQRVFEGLGFESRSAAQANGGEVVYCRVL